MTDHEKDMKMDTAIKYVETRLFKVPLAEVLVDADRKSVV